MKKRMKAICMAAAITAMGVLGITQNAAAYTITHDNGEIHEFFVSDGFAELPTEITTDGWVYSLSPVDNTLSVGWYRGSAPKAVIPHHINGKKVTMLSGVFEEFDGGGGMGGLMPWDNTATSEIVIPCTVTSLRWNTFLCIETVNLAIPPTIDPIFDSAFGGANAMKQFPYRGTILCTKGSAAHQLALNYGFKYRLVDEDYFHFWNSGTVTKAPTVLREGEKQFTCEGCGKTKTEKIAKKASYVKLNVSSIRLKTGQSTTAVKIKSKAAGDKVSSWTSSSSKVAAVDKRSGKITAKKTGTATITVKMASGKTASCKVTVQKTAVKTTKISGLKKSLRIVKGKTAALKPVISPITSREKVTYTSSNKKVAVVNSKGVITAKASGTAKITVKSGTKKFTVTVTVPKKAPTAIKNVIKTKTLKKGASFTLKPKLSPAGSEAKITYASSNKKIAVVTSTGKITAKQKGTATITIKAGKVSVKCKITVK